MVNKSPVIIDQALRFFVQTGCFSAIEIMSRRYKLADAIIDEVIEGEGSQTVKMMIVANQARYDKKWLLRFKVTKEVLRDMLNGEDRWKSNAVMIALRMNKDWMRELPQEKL